MDSNFMIKLAKNFPGYWYNDPNHVSSLDIGPKEIIFYT